MTVIPQWEYRFENVTLSDHDDDPAVPRLNEFGAAGWEVVGFSPAQATSHGLRTVQTTEFVVLLKRPRSV